MNFISKDYDEFTKVILKDIKQYINNIPNEEEIKIYCKEMMKEYEKKSFENTPVIIKDPSKFNEKQKISVYSGLLVFYMIQLNSERENEGKIMENPDLKFLARLFILQNTISSILPIVSAFADQTQKEIFQIAGMKSDKDYVKRINEIQAKLKVINESSFILYNAAKNTNETEDLLSPLKWLISQEKMRSNFEARENFNRSKIYDDQKSFDTPRYKYEEFMYTSYPVNFGAKLFENKNKGIIGNGAEIYYCELTKIYDYLINDF